MKTIIYFQIKIEKACFFGRLECFRSSGFRLSASLRTRPKRRESMAAATSEMKMRQAVSSATDAWIYSYFSTDFTHCIVHNISCYRLSPPPARSCINCIGAERAPENYLRRATKRSILRGKTPDWHGNNFDVSIHWG